MGKLTTLHNALTLLAPSPNFWEKGLGMRAMRIKPEVRKLALQTARHLRKNQTDAEKIFWQHVRNKNFKGLKFRRQKPVFYEYNQRQKFFICDFICPKAKLIIEIDGGIHEKQKEYDKHRKEIIQLKQFKILRFKNEEILNNIDEVFNKIEECLFKTKD
ncbi:endonuclease domain-containing protein [Caldithrix abyssi]|uniref:endonuclease domain-containing protein n=1 Tax=Caldithrix abyssi TaxID=187145 RepID=UPI001C280042|nr:endonuclease domain-containing protein [Caldithrix abyssi]